MYTHALVIYSKEQPIHNYMAFLIHNYMKHALVILHHSLDTQQVPKDRYCRTNVRTGSGDYILFLVSYLVHVRPLPLEEKVSKQSQVSDNKHTLSFCQCKQQQCVINDVRGKCNNLMHKLNRVQGKLLQLGLLMRKWALLLSLMLCLCMFCPPKSGHLTDQEFAISPNDA